MDASPPLSIPRLRLPRYSPQHSDQALTPVAGPSHRLDRDHLHASDDDEDAESTPRMSAAAIPDKQSPRSAASPGLPASNPTARLRALLARVPNSPNAHASSSRPPITLPSSEPESDFEPPHSIPTSSSIARDSLKELFSNALREPGNTPRKAGRPRRNSIDASEVETSMSVEEERAKYKARRRTLSDEEAEKSTSGRSTRSPAASAFDALRQRLNQSTSAMPSLSHDQMVMDMSMPPPNSSTDTAMQPGAPVDQSSDTPPRATSTPMRTFQMSANITNINIHSNLMDQDSEMQHALQDMDSYESGRVSRHRHSTPSLDSLKNPVGPTPRPQPHQASPRPLSWSSHSRSHSTHNLPQPPPPRRGSEDYDTSSSRASSSMSGADYRERTNDPKREQLHDRERGWNSPVPKLPKPSGKHDLSHRHSSGSLRYGHASPGPRLSRKSSAASLASVSNTDGPGSSRASSRASSVASRADYKERMAEFEQERNKEREREWNRPHQKLSRSSSSLSLNKSERVRTTSIPSRPDSAASYLSPVARTPLHRHGSSNSLSSSRPSSPATSISAHDVEEVIEHEFEHQRERNWNAPRPDWSNPLYHRRSLSPLPRSRPGSPTTTPPHPPIKSTTTSRSRANSTTHRDGLSVPSSVPRSKSPIPGDRHPRPRSPLPRALTDKSPSSHARPKSPVPPTPPLEKNEPTQSTPAFRSRFGWSFPQHKVQLPPLELDQDSPEKSAPRPSSRASLSATASTPSHIPVRSPRKSLHSSTPSAANVSDKKKSHRRSVTEFSESIGALPPRIEISSDDVGDELPPVPIVNGNDDLASASEDASKIATGTPTAKPRPLPPPEITTTPATEPPTHVISNGHPLPVQIAQPQPRPESPLVSPPLTPPGADSQPIFNLQTPPRRPQFHTPRQEFETPPPPRGMPDLPGPPSSEDEREEHTPLMQSRDVQGDLTAMKTPRPPGAWLMTPAPSRQFISEPEEAERSSDTAPPEANSSADSGLATPPLTLSRAQTFPLQTPAPPGGWVATPAPATASRRRGSLLKVRFDLESETASEGAAPSAEDGSMGSEADPRQQPAGADASGQLLNGTGNGDASAASSVEPTESSVEPPPTPPSLRERIRKKSPSIRILDAYGREHVETEPVAQSESVPDPTEVPPPDARQQRSSTPPIPRKDGLMNSVATPRNRSGVRVVDAMGREIEEDDSLPLVDDESVLSNTPLSHNEALTRMRDTLSSMKQELSDADSRSTDKAVFDKRTYAALQEQCRNAQLTRSKIAKSLQVAQSAESKFVNHAPFRTKIGNETSALLPTDDAEVRLGWSLLTWRSLACLILVQLLLLAIMYRYAHVQAKKIFLTTYYDSFNPDLYIYLLKPDTTNYLIPTCPSWSIFSVFGSLQRASWRGVFADAWESASCAFSSHLQLTWAGWHHAQDTVPRAWPPT